MTLYSRNTIRMSLTTTTLMAEGGADGADGVASVQVSFRKPDTRMLQPQLYGCCCCCCCCFGNLRPARLWRHWDYIGTGRCPPAGLPPTNGTRWPEK